MRNILFRDILFNLILGFAALIVLMLPFLNDPNSNEEFIPPGNLIVNIVWPVGDIDVDMWVMGPGEINPVGYSNNGGNLFNLLRDDLGNIGDVTELNYENAYSRGVPPGIYQVNVHCYRCRIVELMPINVKVEITLKKPNAIIYRILITNVTLHYTGEEITAVRFELNKDMNVVQGSKSNFFSPLRAYEK